jgi:hypothetical protein
MVNHKDDWRQLPRMGKRKRQVLSILDDAYEYDRAFASRYADLLSEESEIPVRYTPLQEKPYI